MKDLLLSEFKPKSELVVEQHEVLKPKFPVVDFHTHFGIGGFPPGFIDYDPAIKDEGTYNVKDEMKDLGDLGVSAVINLDGFWGEKQDKNLAYIKDCSDRIITFSSVDVTRIDDPDFAGYAVNTIKEAYKKGIKGLKFFKDVSLLQKDRHGNYIRVDDERLKPIWKTAAELHIPVLIHIADPIAFFKPVDQYNERFWDLRSRPRWSFAGEQFFKYEELMEMQEKLLAENPGTVFIIPHVGSSSENLGFVARQLERHPNMYIDIAARIIELGRQPYTSRKFLIKYQDRVVFGTDIVPGRRIHPYYYRFLETWDEYFDSSPAGYQGKWKIYGIGLPDHVLEKIYYKNAVKLVPDLSRLT